MNRRKFIVATGSAILTGSTIRSVNQPSLGLEFELSAVPNSAPSNVDSIIVQFERLEITPKYLDDNAEIDIKIELNINGSNVQEKTITGVEFSNNERLTIRKITNRGSDNASQIKSDLTLGDNLTGEIKVSVSHADISETYQRFFNINEYSGFWDDWADEPSDSGLIKNRKIFSNLSYQGDNQLDSPSTGLRPTWNITQGTASVQDSQELLSLGRNCLVEHNGINLSQFDLSSNNIVIRFKYEFYNGNKNSSDAGFNLTVSNPGGGNSDNFAGYPEDGFTMYFGGGTVYSFSEHSNGSRADLIEGSWASDSDPHVSKLTISDAGTDGLQFEYFYDGVSRGTATSDTFSLDEINTLHFGNRDDQDATDAPVGIKWLEIY